MTAEKPLVSLGLRQCDSSKVNCRTGMAASVTQLCALGDYRLSHEKALQNRRLRQCDSSEMTVANQLSQVICVSATVPYYIGTACNDRRSVALSAQRQTSIHQVDAGRLKTSIPYRRMSAGWL
jgi:predicted lipase